MLLTLIFLKVLFLRGLNIYLYLFILNIETWGQYCPLGTFCMDAFYAVDHDVLQDHSTRLCEVLTVSFSSSFSLSPSLSLSVDFML